MSRWDLEDYPAQHTMGLPGRRKAGRRYYADRGLLVFLRVIGLVAFGSGNGAGKRLPFPRIILWGPYCESGKHHAQIRSYELVD